MIVYLISSYRGMNTGKGGHYYSLMTISKEIAKSEDVLIINIGNFKAPALEEFDKKVIYIHNTFLNTPLVFKKLVSILKNKKTTAIHSFDKHAILFGRYLSHKYNVPLISTKCGGPSYSAKENIVARYFPKIKIQTVFHQKDKEFFEKIDSIEKLELISGRVKFDTSLVKYSQEIEDFYKDIELKMMRICRIGDFYFETITAMISFLEEQLKLNKKSRLIIIGHVEDDKFIYKLQDLIKSKSLSEYVLILTDSHHTINASGFLYYSNIVMGTGRSFMEAAAYGHIMLAPVANSKFPTLATLENIEILESNNFSTRIPKSNTTDYYQKKDKWNNLFNNKTEKKEYSHWIKTRFNTHYSIESASKKYLELYKLKKTAEILSFDFIKHFIFFEISVLKATLKRFK